MSFPQQSTCRGASRHRRAAFSVARRLEPAAARDARCGRERRLAPPRRQPSEGARRRPSRCTAAPVATVGGPSQSSGATVLSVTPLVAAPAPSAPPAAVCRAGRGRKSAGVRVSPRFLRAGACVSPPRHRFLPLLLSHRLRRTDMRRSRSQACRRCTPTSLRAPRTSRRERPLVQVCVARTVRLALANASGSAPQTGQRLNDAHLLPIDECVIKAVCQKWHLAACKTLASSAGLEPHRWP